MLAKIIGLRLSYTLYQGVLNTDTYQDFGWDENLDIWFWLYQVCWEKSIKLRILLKNPKNQSLSSELCHMLIKEQSFSYHALCWDNLRNFVVWDGQGFF